MVFGELISGLNDKLFLGLLGSRDESRVDANLASDGTQNQIAALGADMCQAHLILQLNEMGTPKTLFLNSLHHY